MAIASRQQLKAWFRNFMKPTQTQFAAWLDAYWHKDDLIPQESIEGWDEFLQGIPDMPNLAGYLTKDDTQNVVLGDDTKKLITDFMLLADWAENEKIKPSRLPDLAITTLVEGVVETSIAAFAANADNYDFQTGDVVPIIGSDNARILYMFKGGGASFVENYFVIDESRVAVSNVIGLAEALSDKMDTDMNNLDGDLTAQEQDTIKSKLGIVAPIPLKWGSTWEGSEQNFKAYQVDALPTSNIDPFGIYHVSYKGEVFNSYMRNPANTKWIDANLLNMDIRMDKLAGDLLPAEQDVIKAKLGIVEGDGLTYIEATSFSGVLSFDKPYEIGSYTNRVGTFTIDTTDAKIGTINTIFFNATALPTISSIKWVDNADVEIFESGKNCLIVLYYAATGQIIGNILNV